MKRFRFYLFFVFLSVEPVLSAEEEPAAMPSEAERLIAERENATLVADLRDLLARRDSFFAEADYLAENERTRQAGDIAERFDILLSRFPNSVPVLYFYAEFLRDGGELDQAEKMLKKAEKADSTFVPVQFLLAEVLQAQGNSVAALPYFERSVYDDPGNAEYQCAFGEFLSEARAVLIEKCELSREELDARMQAAFLAASVAEPSQLDFLWRYAESFYDVEAPDWTRALSVWERVECRLNKEKQANLIPVVQLHRARIFAELGRTEEANALLIKTAGVPALERSRRTVYEIIEKQRHQ